ncbi:hypothetical protein COCOBI_13-2290 [Coccomyxa sp. Obi]|nr:hypothetical protein COCOBI_13-2290 [Coccomyxa sp. Obi]
MRDISSNLLPIQCGTLRLPCRSWLAGPNKVGRAAVAAKVHGHSGVPPGHSPGESEAHDPAERIRYEHVQPMEDDAVSEAYEWADSSSTAPEELHGMLVDATPASPPPERPLSGWVLAASVLLAVRLGRSASESARFDMAHLQREVEQSWEARSEALRRSRAADPEAAAAAEARMTLARERAIATQREREERDAALLRAAERERQKAQAAAAAERAAFEAQEARMAAELEQRTQQERRLLQQAAERARLAAEQRRKEAEAAAAAAEAERRAAEEAEARRREEERKEREAEKRALRRLQKKYAVRLLGSVEVARPPKGAMTEERLPKEAVVEVTVTVGSALGGEAEPTKRLFPSVDAAREAVDELAARACSAAAQLYGSSVRLQSMAGQGALQDMGEVELQHWLRTAAVRAAFTGAAHLRALLDAHAAQPQQHQQRSFEVRTERGVLPAEHPQRVEARLATAINALQREDDATATSVITSYMADEEEAIRKDGGGCVREHAGEALALAHFLDETWAQRPARRIEASPWYDAAGGLAQRLLGQHTRSAPKDSLGPVARVVGAVLGPDHAVAQMLRAAAEANLSPATLTALRERERIQQAELAAALLEEEWPDEAEAAAARAAAREASTPVPERVWLCSIHEQIYIPGNSSAD